MYQYVGKCVFYDRTYRELWDFYFNVGDIFKNVCEQNNTMAKLFFTEFTLELNTQMHIEPANDMDNSYDFSMLKKVSKSEPGSNNISQVKLCQSDLKEGEVDQAIV